MDGQSWGRRAARCETSVPPRKRPQRPEVRPPSPKLEPATSGSRLKLKLKCIYKRAVAWPSALERLECWRWTNKASEFSFRDIKSKSRVSFWGFVLSAALGAIGSLKLKLKPELELGLELRPVDWPAGSLASHRGDTSAFWPIERAGRSIQRLLELN